MPKTTDSAVLAAQQEAESQPIFLLEIELASQTLRYTDYPGGLTFPSSGGSAYTAMSFDFGRITNTITGEVDRVELTLDNAAKTFSTLLGSYEFQGRKVNIKRIFGDLLSSSAYSVTVFWGWIGPIDVNEVEFRCEVLSPSVALDRPYPPRLYQSNCPWVFGGTECGAALGTLTGQIIDSGSSTSAVLDAARTEADDYWRDGVITLTSGAISGEVRKIASSTSGQISLLVAFSAAPAAGVTYTISRGCDKSAMVCWQRYDNFENFGGFDQMPGLEVQSA